MLGRFQLDGARAIDWWIPSWLIRSGIQKKYILLNLSNLRALRDEISFWIEAPGTELRGQSTNIYSKMKFIIDRGARH